MPAFLAAALPYLPYILMAAKEGAGMYSRHRQGQEMEDAEERQAEEQRRLDSIAMLQGRAPGQAGLQYKMPRGAQIADVLGSLAGLGSQVALMKGGGAGGGAGSPPGLGRRLLADPSTLQKPADYYTRNLRPNIRTWRPQRRG